jgi:deoxyribodipyrimidine photolyase-like uncharacterized protein
MLNTIGFWATSFRRSHAALAEADPKSTRVLMIESKARGSVLRYHKLKLVLSDPGSRYQHCGRLKLAAQRLRVLSFEPRHLTQRGQARVR